MEDALRLHRAVLSKDAQATVQDLAPLPAATAELSPPLVLLSCGHSVMRRLGEHVEGVLGATCHGLAEPGAWGLRLSAGEKNSGHQLLPLVFGPPPGDGGAPGSLDDPEATTSTGISCLVADWRLWEAARPAHGLFVVSHVSLTFEGAMQSMAAAAARAAAADTPAGRGSCFRLSCFPGSLAPRALEALPECICLHPKEFTHALFLVALPHGRYGVGAGPGVWLANLGQGRRGDEAQRRVSRAYYKMREAAETWPRILRMPTKAGNSPTGDRHDVEMAFDLGASPGGWSEWLVEQGGVGRCVAIDPAAMDDRVIHNPRVVHLRQSVEAAVASGELARAASTSEGSTAQVVVCDMNSDPRAAAEAVQHVLPWVAEDAVLVLTIKMVKRGGLNHVQLETEATNALQDNWKVQGVRQLFNNSRHERTLVATRKKLSAQVDPGHHNVAVLESMPPLQREEDAAGVGAPFLAAAAEPGMTTARRGTKREGTASDGGDRGAERSVRSRAGGGVAAASM